MAEMSEPRRTTGSLAGRRLLVIGAGTRPDPDPDAPIGNGRAISVLAAREGAAVACADLVEAAAAETAGLVEHEGGRAVAITADASDSEQSAEMVTSAAQLLGGLDGIVLNVGI